MTAMRAGVGKLGAARLARLTVARTGGQAPRMPSPEDSSEPKKLPLVKLALGAAALKLLGVALLLGAAAALVLRGVNLLALVDQGMAFVRGAGPWVFFGGLTLLPAFGAPVLAFTLSAGEAFGAQMTIPGVIGATLAAVAANLMLTYWLARYALRPLLTRLIERYGYHVPRVTSGNTLAITLVVRLTPGPPFFLQSYILGLAEVPFATYLIVSWLCVVPWAVAAVVLGRALLHGNFRLALTAFGVLVVAVVVVRWLRKKYAERED